MEGCKATWGVTPRPLWASIQVRPRHACCATLTLVAFMPAGARGLPPYPAACLLPV